MARLKRPSTTPGTAAAQAAISDLSPHQLPGVRHGQAPIPRRCFDRKIPDERPYGMAALHGDTADVPTHAPGCTGHQHRYHRIPPRRLQLTTGAAAPRGSGRPTWMVPWQGSLVDRFAERTQLHGAYPHIRNPPGPSSVKLYEHTIPPSRNHGYRRLAQCSSGATSPIKRRALCR
jgi:hypothetical protein